MKRPRPIWAIDTTRTKDGRPVTKRFTELGWKLLAGDDNLKAGRWKRIPGPKPAKAVHLKEKPKPTTKVNATRASIDLAKNKGINIEQVEGSGEGGRITKSDVEEYLLNIRQDEEE